jgi:hypothetical protein
MRFMGGIDAIDSSGIEAVDINAWRMSDIALARALDGKQIPHWSALWPRIGELQRRGLLRVNVLSRWMAEATAAGEAG